MLPLGRVFTAHGESVDSLPGDHGLRDQAAESPGLPSPGTTQEKPGTDPLTA